MMKNIIEAVKRLAFFIADPDDSVIPRWIEIAYGLIFWAMIGTIVYCVAQ